MEERFHLECEESIIWLEDPLKYPYLRVTELRSVRRKSGPRKAVFPAEKKIVGYAIFHTKPAEDYRKYTSRRLFMLYRQDLDLFEKMPNTEYIPCEGVRPGTVKVGVWGHQ